MKKKMIGLLAALLAAVLPAAAFPAESLAAGSQEVPGGSWTVGFDGKNISSTYDEAEVNKALKALQPGDTIKLEVVLSNSSGKTTDWYMANEVKKSLESSSAAGGAYSYKLTYTSGGETVVLYDSSSIGGEDDEEGLKTATSSLDEFFFLASLEDGGTGKVVLEIGLEGESLANAYQLAQGIVQMNFAVENVETPNPGKGEDSVTVVTVTKNRETVEDASTVTKTITYAPLPDSATVMAPHTGDDSRALFYTAAALAAGLVCLALVIFRLRGKDKEGNGYGKV